MCLWGYKKRGKKGMKWVKKAINTNADDFFI